MKMENNMPDSKEEIMSLEKMLLNIYLQNEIIMTSLLSKKDLAWARSWIKETIKKSLEEE